MAKHSLDFWLTSEDLPDPNNRVTIGRDGKIVMTYTPNNQEAHQRLQAKLKYAMKQTNCPIHGHDCHQGLFGAKPLRGATNSACWCRPPERHYSLRSRPEDLGAGRELQGP